MNLLEIKNKKSIAELLEFGIINVDKPCGPTSFDISERVGKILGARKTSHFGTLDPKVTGILPIALNRACKLTGFFLGENKTYVGIMRFHREICRERVEKEIKNKFLGEITQKPPVKSRVKRQERQREIYEFEILEQEGKDFLFKTKVQGGTYIRKLVDDLGRNLGTGAHMLELRRISAGIFNEDSIVNLYELEKAVENYKNGKEEELRKLIFPAEIVSEVYPILKIRDKELKKILTGKPIHKEDLIEKKKFGKNQIVSVFSGEKFIGMYEIINEGNIFAKPKFVFN